MKTLKCLALIGLLMMGLLLGGCNDINSTQMDKNFDGLGNFKLDAPFTDTDTVFFREFSTQGHVGIDFFTKEGIDRMPFYAMYECVVNKIEYHKMLNQGGTDNWAVRMWLLINSEYFIELNFETWGSTDAVKQLQEQNLFVKVGDHIQKGDLIGNLIICQESAHVHFSLYYSEDKGHNEMIAPEPFFSETAMEKLQAAVGDGR